MLIVGMVRLQFNSSCNTECLSIQCICVVNYKLQTINSDFGHQNSCNCLSIEVNHIIATIQEMCSTDGQENGKDFKDRILWCKINVSLCFKETVKLINHCNPYHVYYECISIMINVDMNCMINIGNENSLWQ